jgi:hypothetical protein
MPADFWGSKLLANILNVVGALLLLAGLASVASNILDVLAFSRWLLLLPGAVTMAAALLFFGVGRCLHLAARIGEAVVKVEAPQNAVVREIAPASN